MQFIQENIFTIAMAVFALVMLVWPPLSRKIYGIKEVGSLEATQLINHHEAMVIDVREDSELRDGMIPNAKHIPLGQIQARVKELDRFRSRPVIIACRSGARSSGACRLLRKAGFTDVYNLAGGMINWQQANLPVEKR